MARGAPPATPSARRSRRRAVAAQAAAKRSPRWGGRASRITAAASDPRWLAVIAWAAIIFAVSGTPSLGSGLGTWDTVLRKAAHVTEYAVLGVLLARVLAAPAALLAGVAYAASDELHQHVVPGRNGAPLDVAIDAVGLILGIVVLRRLAR